MRFVLGLLLLAGCTTAPHVRIHRASTSGEVRYTGLLTTVFFTDSSRTIAYNGAVDSLTLGFTSGALTSVTIRDSSTWSATLTPDTLLVFLTSRGLHWRLPFVKTPASEFYAAQAGVCTVWSDETPIVADCWAFAQAIQQ